MKEAGGRSFTILDAMILVAAIAVSIAMAGRPAGDYWRIAGSIVSHWAGVISATPQGADTRDYSRYARAERDRELLGLTTDPNFLIEVPFPFLLTLTPAFLLLRLSRPRPRWVDLVKQPGAVACAGGILTVFVAILLAGYAGTPWEALSLGVVPAAWTALAVGRWWRSEPSWLDRGGRAMGVCWIVSAIYVCWLWTQ